MKSEELRKIIKSRYIYQRELAEKYGLKDSELSRVINGRASNLGEPILERTAKILQSEFGIHPSELPMPPKKYRKKEAVK